MLPKQWRGAVAARRNHGSRKAKPRIGSFEQLESRTLLSASTLATLSAQPLLAVSPQVTSTVPYGYTPAQIRHAYGFDQVSFTNSGKTVQGNGAGQTIAIVDAYSDPNIVADLNAFDSQFGLAAPPSFKVVNENGSSSLPAANAGWSLEISLDVEWAHAVAPGANILLVEASSNSLNDLLSAVNYARQQPGVSTVSMSWAAGEFSSESSYDSYFTTPSGHVGVTFLASSGDSGGPAGWPAVSPNVVAVGGTTLSLTSSATRSTETAWSGSSGSFSLYESEPSFQAGVQSSGRRSAPDVAYDANPNTGVAVYDSVSYDGQSGWFCVGGTSAGAPQWAGLIAVADQGRVLAGLGTLKSTDSSIYALPSSDFYDVTSGGNLEYRATKGYDEVTGLGAPLANLVIENLVYGNSTTSSPPGGPTLPPWNPSGPDGPFSRFSDVVVPASASPSAAVGLAPQEGSAGGSASLATAGQFLGGRPIALADSLDTTEPLPPAGDHACSIRSGDTPTATLTRATDSYFAALADPQFGLAAADLPLVA